MECEYCMVNIALLDQGLACLQVKEIDDLGDVSIWTFCGYECMRRMFQ